MSPFDGSVRSASSIYSRKRLVLWALIAILLLWHANDLRKTRDAGKIPLHDFIEYWAAGRVFVSGGNPYNSSELLAAERTAGWTDSKPIMMWNPPWTLPLILPFAFLPYWTGRGCWFVFNFASVLVSADFFWRQYGGSVSRRWISWLAVLFFIPVGTSLYAGQISPLVLAGLAGFAWALSRNRTMLAGVFTLALAVKPHLLYLFWLFLLLWMVKKRDWRVLSGALVAVFVSSLIVVLVDRTIFLDFYQAIISPSSGPQIWQTPTWGVALLMLFPKASAWVRFIPSALGIVLSFWLWRNWSADFSWQRHLPVIILLSVTSSSFTWMFDWVVLLPVVVLILCWFSADPARRWWLLAGLAIMQPMLVFSPAVSRTNFYTLWLPPALWLLYWIGSVSQRSRGRFGTQAGISLGEGRTLTSGDR